MGRRRECTVKYWWWTTRADGEQHEQVFFFGYTKLSAWMHTLGRADFRLAPRQWETLLQTNAVSHWLGTNLESSLFRALICAKSLCRNLTLNSTYVHQWYKGIYTWSTLSYFFRWVIPSDSLWPSDAIFRHGSWSIFFQLMDYHLFGAKSLRNPRLSYCPFDPFEKTTVVIFEDR